MAPQVVHLPDGQNFTVTPVFSGLFFKSHELNTHHNAFPIGWTVVLNTQDEDETQSDTNADGDALADRMSHVHIHSYTKPTLENDNLFISSISNPSSSEFKPAASPTRQIAMMIWVTLYWYFHQPEPSPYLRTEASKDIPEEARPRGDWRINIKRDGVLRGRNLIPKLERMGLIASMESSVGSELTDGEGWDHMFVSKRMFWQIPGRLFLFTLQPNARGSSMPGSPASSRPSSPSRMSPIPTPHGQGHLTLRSHSHSPHSSVTRPDSDDPIPTTLVSAPSFPIGPFFSSSHLPTYYPPGPLMYTITGNVRHPLRPKPPRMGEVFYTRFVPSVGQYLAFRVASMSPKPVPYQGPAGPKPPKQGAQLSTLSDAGLVQSWLAKPRVAKFWGDYEPNFLTNAVKSRHSFPIIGMWDGVPFGYFEVYWVKEDILGEKLGSDADDWDRGLHVVVGEEWARGRVPIWLSSLVHYCFTADYRTMSVCLEPRVDNAR